MLRGVSRLVCKREAKGRAALPCPALKHPVHHQCVHEAERRVQEGAGKTSYNFESHSLPEVDSPLVAADDKIKLHGAKAAGFRMAQGVLAQFAVESPGIGLGIEIAALPAPIGPGPGHAVEDLLGGTFARALAAIGLP